MVAGFAGSGGEVAGNFTVIVVLLFGWLIFLLMVFLWG
jgi:hypothetical protein